MSNLLERNAETLKNVSFSVLKIFFCFILKIKELSQLFIHALGKDELHSVVNFQVDHKKVYQTQGTTLGIHARFTWINKYKQFRSFRLDFILTLGFFHLSYRVHQFEIFKSIFLEMIKCDPTKPDKSCAATAKKLVDFIDGKFRQVFKWLTKAPSSKSLIEIRSQARKVSSKGEFHQ